MKSWNKGVACCGYIKIAEFKNLFLSKLCHNRILQSLQPWRNLHWHISLSTPSPMKTSHIAVETSQSAIVLSHNSKTNDKLNCQWTAVLTFQGNSSKWKKNCFYQNPDPNHIHSAGINSWDTVRPNFANVQPISL